MFITKKDGAIGMTVCYKDSEVGVILLREVYDKPLCIEYVKQKWMAESTTEFKEQNTLYIFKLFLEHMKVYGASDEVVDKFKMIMPDSLKLDMKVFEEQIRELYKEFLGTAAKRQRQEVAKFINRKGVDWGSEKTWRQIMLATDKDLLGESDADTARAIIIKYNGKLSDWEMKNKFKSIARRMPAYDPILFYKQLMEKEGILRDNYDN